jgi:hypothetical protein
MMRSPARARRDRRTPKLKAMPSRRAAARLSEEICTRCKALRERIGKTHGITFRINPPRKAKSKITVRLEDDPPLFWIWSGLLRGIETSRARCPKASQGFSATRTPWRDGGSLAFSLRGRVS